MSFALSDEIAIRKALDPWQACFVISSIGEDDSPTRIRADYVLKTYIEQACQLAGYTAMRADSELSTSIQDGIITLLDRAPMCIAYLGCYPWNQNVLIELGYRIAAHLPVLLLIDSTIAAEPLPYILAGRQRFSIPAETLAPDDGRVQSAIKRLSKGILAEESNLANLAIDCSLPVAMVHSWQPQNGSPLDPRKMIYVRASNAATEIFGFRDGPNQPGRLVHRTMSEFLENMKYRMDEKQYQSFLDSQGQARAQILDGDARVNIPITFAWHRNRRYIGHSFLPIITENFVSSDRQWSSLRVLYLDVTSSVVKLENGVTGYLNSIDAPGSPKLDTQPIKVFLSHSHQDWDAIQPLMERLTELSDSISPWVDRNELMMGDRFVAKIGTVIDTLECAFVFFGAEGINRFQMAEIETLLNEQTRRDKLEILPICLESVTKESLPSSLALLRKESISSLSAINNDKYLMEYFHRKYPGRFYC